MHCARPAQRGAPSGLWGPGGRIPEAILMKSVTSLALTAALLAMPNSLEVEIKAAGMAQRCGVANDGYWGTFEYTFPAWSITVLELIAD